MRPAALIIAVITVALSSASAPPDKPQHLRGYMQHQAMEKAIAPSVAKACATYPAAKKRFLLGLPPRYFFTVWIYFDESDQKTREYRGEYVFVAVETIKDGTIYGRINDKIIGLKGYKYGDRVQVAESRVQNWTIIRPDGSEEGNYVGKFLDHWRP